MFIIFNTQIIGLEKFAMIGLFLLSLWLANKG